MAIFEPGEIRRISVFDWDSDKIKIYYLVNLPEKVVVRNNTVIEIAAKERRLSKTLGTER